MTERREGPRSTFHIKTEISLIETKEWINLLRANISFGGIGGYTRDLVEQETQVLVRLYFLTRSEEEVMEVVSGKIAWAKRDGNFTAFGISFPPLKKEEHPLLVSYLQYADQFD